MKARRKDYRILDAQNQLHAIHVRVEDPNGRKRFAWYHPNGQLGLGGRATASLPLYGSEHLPNWKPGEPVVVVEGEKATDALISHGFNALGTVTGSAGCPDVSVLELLRDKDVILWPDADEKGRAHMRRVGEAVGSCCEGRNVRVARRSREGRRSRLRDHT